MQYSRDIFLKLLHANRNGDSKGMYAVCSANAEVIEACIKQAKSDNTIALIESTSNQVNQYGGYTGMKPADFVNDVKCIAKKVRFPFDLVLLGGDHLGPNAWQNLAAKEAMERSKELVSAYVKNGYLKIHIDTSMFCADDGEDRKHPLPDEIIAERTAILCQAAEDSWARNCQGKPKPLYIIGTEVPIPGGAQEKEKQIEPTKTNDVSKTITTCKTYFEKYGLTQAWERVIGVVVQPGVEFGDDSVFHYDRSKTFNLSRTITNFDNLVYEAHSTDYQTETNLKKMVEDHFCILKVDPWLTFAYREALFALESMEIEILGQQNKNLSRLSSTLDKLMSDQPVYWEKYYTGNEKQKSFKRKYSYSDRLRYYWPMKELEECKDQLYKNLECYKIPASLLSQFMPSQYYQVKEGLITAKPKELVINYIQTVTGIYSRACGLS